jgi:hypothetical protein
VSNFLRYGLVVLAGLLWHPVAGMAAEMIGDPKVMADKVAQTIATADIAKIKAVFVTASVERMSEDDVRPAVDPFASVFEKCRTPGTPDLLATREYGNSIARYWYRVIFRKKGDDTGYEIVYARLTFTNVIDTWILTNFKLTTDLDGVLLP